MKKKIIIFSVFILIVIFSSSFSYRNIFYTTHYYKTPLLAYNDNCGHNITYGDIKAKNEIGVLSLDNENCLFLGEINDNCFVVAEIAIKNEKYAFKGTTVIYDLTEQPDDYSSRKQTYTSDGHIYWAIMYERPNPAVSPDINFIETYTHSNGKTIYLVVYNT